MHSDQSVTVDNCIDIAIRLIARELEEIERSEEKTLMTTQASRLVDYTTLLLAIKKADGDARRLDKGAAKKIRQMTDAELQAAIASAERGENIELS